jgi:hypothetical protein
VKPDLAPPGAGIPALQRWVGGHVLLPRYCRRLTWEGVPDRLEAQGQALQASLRGCSPEELARRVLVPRQIGLEDSSRWHSAAMVLDHLAIVGTRVALLVRALTHGVQPPGALGTAQLKPEPDVPPAEAARRYVAMLVEFRARTIDDGGDRDTPLRFSHPWFGPLSAFQWMCFAPFHQEIHLRQMRRIVERLNRPSRWSSRPA